MINQLRKDLLEILRTYRAYVVLGLFVFIGTTSPIIMKVLPEILPKSEEFQVVFRDTTALSAATQYFDNVTQLVSLVIVFLAAGLTAGRGNRRFLQILLTKPLGRKSVIASGFTAYTLLIFAGLAVGHACFAIYTQLLFGGIAPAGFVLTLFACAACLCLLLALTMFMGVVTRKAAAAGILSLVIFFVLSLVLGFLPGSWDLSPTSMFSLSSKATVGAAGIADFAPAFVFCVALTGVLLYLAMALFQRRDVT